MSTPHHTRLPAALLIGLPLLSNAASFVVFAPLFAPGRTPADADVRLRSGAHQPILALFHGVFNPLAMIATLLQGLAWGWTYRRTEPTGIGIASAGSTHGFGTD